MQLTIIYRDKNFIAIDKPAGLLVHRTGLAADATEFALQLLRDQIGETVHPCHRLDRPTSGILLFGLSKEAQSFAEQQFMHHTVDKCYEAIVRGWTEEVGLIDYPLKQEDPPHQVQEARTAYRQLCRSELPLPAGRYQTARFSLLELKPETGRKHQLRRHLAHLRHPIPGDTRHGDGAQNRFLREHFNSHALLLRATKLELPHPNNDSSISIQAPPDPEFERIKCCLQLKPATPIAPAWWHKGPRP